MLVVVSEVLIANAENLLILTFCSFYRFVFFVSGLFQFHFVWLPKIGVRDLFALFPWAKANMTHLTGAIGLGVPADWSDHWDIAEGVRDCWEEGYAASCCCLLLPVFLFRFFFFFFFLLLMMMMMMKMTMKMTMKMKMMMMMMMMMMMFLLMLLLLGWSEWSGDDSSRGVVPHHPKSINSIICIHSASFSFSDGPMRHPTIPILRIHRFFYSLLKKIHLHPSTFGAPTSYKRRNIGPL